MELHLSTDQEARLARIAAHLGKPVEEIVTEAALGALRQNDLFLAGVDRGIAAADRGEFLEEEEMDARVEKMLHS